MVYKIRFFSSQIMLLCIIMAFPCIVCTNECENDTIQCANCKNWVHAQCANLNESDLKSWSQISLNYLCKCCAFKGSDYDCSSALSRLQTALLSNRRNGLTNQTKSEAKLLHTYRVEVPKHQANPTYEIDEESVKVLNMFHPVMNTVYSPALTVGDGNCLYRAVSFALTGSDQFHVLLRLLTAIELVTNRAYYDTERKYNDFLNDVRIVTSDYRKLVSDVVVENTYSEMAHIYALGAALGEPIQSYFPPQIKPDLSSAFTRTVVGREVQKECGPQIMIMWTSMLAPINMSAFSANHFVPLLNKPDIDDIVDSSPGTSTVSQDSKSNPTTSEQIDSLKNDGSPDISVNKFALFEGDQSDSFHMYGCETLDEVVTLSDISVRDLVTESSNDSSPAETGCGMVDESSETLEETVISSEQCTDTITESPSASQLQSDNQGSLVSGFLDSSTVISHLLKDTTGLLHIPSGAKDNVFFLVNNKVNIDKRLNGKRSAFSDDRGIWNSSSGSSPKSYFVLHENGDMSSVYIRNGNYCVKKQVKKQVEYRPLNPQPEKEQIVLLHRYYTTHKLNKTYKKKVTWLGEGGLESPLAMVEYVGKFPGLAPHGLAKTDEGFVRRPDHVMADIDELTNQKCTPADIYLTLKGKYDETTRPTMESIYNKRRYQKSKAAQTNEQITSTNIADQICHLENMVTDNDEFVRSIIRTGGKSPTTILYTDDQIEDLKKLCCTGQTVLGVDKTFMLCKMHVTVTCYKQLTVDRQRTEQPPLFIGPMFVHDNSDYETYSYFFHHLKLKLAGTNLTKLVIGSDDEQAMVKAITTEFPQSTHVLCTRHLEQNARQHLEDDGVPRLDRSVILNMLFGRDGLANVTDDICFDSKCDEIESYCANFSDKFVQYFQKRLKGHIKTKVNEPLRDGLISSDWTNNNCESINHVLKQTVDWQSKSLPEFVRLVKRLVIGQFKELRSALCSTGNFRLAVTHKHFQVTKDIWIDMTDQQRTNLYKRYRQFVVKIDRIVVSTDGHSSCIAPRTDGKKPGQRKRKVNIRTVTLKKART